MRRNLRLHSPNMTSSGLPIALLHRTRDLFPLGAELGRIRLGFEKLTCLIEWNDRRRVAFEGNQIWRLFSLISLGKPLRTPYSYIWLLPMSQSPPGPILHFSQHLYLRLRVSQPEPCILNFRSVFLPLHATYPHRLQNIYHRTTFFGARADHQQLLSYHQPRPN